MPLRPPNLTTWSLSLALLAAGAACDGCRGRRPAPGGPGSFSGQSARLASVPAGWERSETRFSKDGRHVAFVAVKDGRHAVFLDGRQGKPYENAWRLVFGEGRAGLAFVATKDGKALVVVDGEEGASYDEVGSVRFAPDGRVVYSATRGQQWFLVVGTRATLVPGTGDPSPELSADGQRVVFAELQPSTGKTHLKACTLELAGCSQGAGYDDLLALKVDASRRRLAFLVGSGGKQAIGQVSLDQPGLEEKLGSWYDEIPLFSLSDGGGHLAFLAGRGEERVLVKDGVEVPLGALGSPMELVVSRSGMVAATAFGQQGMLLLLDGKALGPEQEGVSSPTFSADGAQSAHAADGGSRSTVVVNGEAGPPFDKVVTPAFAPDGTKVVYRARSKGERFVVVADTRARTLREHPRYEEVHEVVFSPDGTAVGYGVLAGADLWWKVEKL